MPIDRNPVFAETRPLHPNRSLLPTTQSAVWAAGHRNGYAYKYCYILHILLESNRNYALRMLCGVCSSSWEWLLRRWRAVHDYHLFYVSA